MDLKTLKGHVDLINGKVCFNTSLLCEVLDITRPSLSVWEKDGCPKVTRGWWSIADVLRWRGLVSPQGLKTAEDIESYSLAQQKLYYETKYKQSQVESTDLKNAISKRDYIPKNEIITELQRFLVVLKNSMLGYSRKIAAEMSMYVDKPICRKIENQINELTLDALSQLSIDGVYVAKKKR